MILFVTMNVKIDTFDLTKAHMITKHEAFISKHKLHHATIEEIAKVMISLQENVVLVHSDIFNGRVFDYSRYGIENICTDGHIVDNDLVNIILK